MKSTNYDAVFIDDDWLYRRLWALRAAEHHKRLLIFVCVREFYEVCENIDRDTPVYIDSELGEGVRGEVELKNIRDNLGFRRVFIATGHSKYDFQGVHDADHIIGKAPPWPKLRRALGAKGALRQHNK